MIQETTGIHICACKPAQTRYSAQIRHLRVGNFQALPNRKSTIMLMTFVINKFALLLYTCKAISLAGVPSHKA